MLHLLKSLIIYQYGAIYWRSNVKIHEHGEHFSFKQQKIVILTLNIAKLNNKNNKIQKYFVIFCCEHSYGILSFYFLLCFYEQKIK